MTERTLCHDKPVPWMTLAEMNAELTDLFCSSLASSIVSLYRIHFWTNMACVYFSYSNCTRSKKAILVCDGRFCCTREHALCHYPVSLLGACRIYVTPLRLLARSAKEKFIRRPKLIICKGFLPVIQVYFQDLDLFPLPFPPLLWEQNNNRVFCHMLFSSLNISVLYNHYMHKITATKHHISPEVDCRTYKSSTFFLLFIWLQAWLHCSVHNYFRHRKETEILPEKPCKDTECIYIFSKNQTHFLEITFPLGNL